MNPRYILVLFSGIVVCTLEYYIYILEAQPENTISAPPMKRPVLQIGNLAKHSTEIVNEMQVTFAYLEGTFLTSAMGMDELTTEMHNYALLSDIVSASGGPYYFKDTRMAATTIEHKKMFKSFMDSIDVLHKYDMIADLLQMNSRKIIRPALA
ncbi:MAG: hypothetical protein QF622_07850 [Candidatus Marinimicrobia bacterium]|nr:hypothetical protein [Candidatus Neomarinimicrobiota bacterium]